jgi:hypothetical protein
MNVINVGNVENECENVENECENAIPLKNNMNSGPQKNIHSFPTFITLTTFINHIYHINHIHHIHRCLTQ